MNDFQNVVYDCWFAPYRRVKNNDSSGFEHVIVGEEKNGKITGLHNWIQYYIEEKKGNIDYLGWVGKQDQDNGDDVNLVSVAFAWADDDPETEVKPMSTSELQASLPMCQLASLPGVRCQLLCSSCAALLPSKPFAAIVTEPAHVDTPAYTLLKPYLVCSARWLQC
eukprot:SAG31_NODE_1451_length_8305_cov_8.321350_6_plen_166_part_00